MVGQIGDIAVPVDATATATADQEAAKVFLSCKDGRLVPTFGKFRGRDVDPAVCPVHLAISPQVSLQRCANLQSYFNHSHHCVDR